MALAFDPTQPLAGPGSPPLSAPARGNFAALTEGSFVSLAADPTFLIWTTSSNPAHWALTGTAAAVSRESTLTSSLDIEGFAGKVVAGGAAIARLSQAIFPAAVFPTKLRGREFSVGMYLYATAASAVRPFIYDGNGFAYPAADHSGGSSWEWLKVTKTLHASATELKFGMEVSVSQTGYMAGASPLFGPVQPAEYLPPMSRLVSYRVGDDHGNIDTGDPRHCIQFARPGLVRDISAYLDTAPTGQDAILDFLTWDGAAFTTAYASTKVVITAGQKFGSRVPDGTYERRCVTGLFGAGATAPAGAVAKLNWTQKGSGVAGANSSITVRVLEFARPWEVLLGITDVA